MTTYAESPLFTKNGFKLFEVLDENGKVVGYAIFTPEGTLYGSYGAYEDAVEAFNELTDEPPPPGSGYGYN